MAELWTSYINATQEVTQVAPSACKGKANLQEGDVKLGERSRHGTTWCLSYAGGGRANSSVPRYCCELLLESKENKLVETACLSPAEKTVLFLVVSPVEPLPTVLAPADTFFFRLTNFDLLHTLGRLGLAGRLALGWQCVESVDVMSTNDVTMPHRLL
jgi:hypothetical protein